MDSLFFFTCLTINLLLVLFIYILYSKYWSKYDGKNSILMKLFFYINIYKLFFNGVIVDILRIFSGGTQNQKYDVASFEILNVVMIDFISNIIYFSFFTFLLFLFVKKKEKINLKISLEKQLSVLTVISILTIGTYLFRTFFQEKLWLFNSAINFIGPICAVLTCFLALKLKKYFLFSIGTLTLIIIIFFTILNGLRGSIFGIGILILLFSYIEFDTKTLKKVLLAGIIPVILVYNISVNLSSIKYAIVEAAANNTYDFSNYNGYLNFAKGYFANDPKIKKIKTKSKPILEEFEFRFGAPTLFSVGFLRLVERNDYAYAQPILNSFYSFLPRQLFTSEKPWPSSSDGSEKSMGMYKCVSEIVGTQKKTFMTDFSVASHFYWEFGWLGVFFLSLIPAIYNIIIFSISRFKSYVGVVLFLVSFKPFYFYTKLWISEIITMIPTIILPTLLLIFFLQKIIPNFATWNFKTRLKFL